MKIYFYFKKNVPGIQCPGGMIYTESARVSDTSCSDLWRDKQILYENIHAPGCVCPDDLYLHDGICIPKKECPCANRFEPDRKPYPPGAIIDRDCETW